MDVATLVMVDLSIVLSTLISQAPLIAVVILILLLYMNKRFNEVEQRFNRIEQRISRMERRIDRIEKRIEGIEQRIDKMKQMISGKFDEVHVRFNEVNKRLDDFSNKFSIMAEFNDVLISMLQSKGYLTDSEVISLKGYVRLLIPHPSSKYYTEKVRRKLIEILDKPIEEFTWDDIDELEKIFELLLKEASETGRKDLVSFAGKLKAFTAVMKGELLRRGKLPKLRKW